MRKTANGRIAALFAALLVTAAPLSEADAQSKPDTATDAGATATPSVTGSTPAAVAVSQQTSEGAAPAQPAVLSTAEKPASESQSVASKPTEPAQAPVTPAAPVANEIKTASPAPVVIPAPVAPAAAATTATEASPKEAPAKPAEAAAPLAVAAEKPAIAAAPPAVDPRIALVAAIRDQLAALPATKSKTVSAPRDALRAFYQADGARPLFITATGLSPDAKAASELISQADDWGLRAKDFALPAALPTNPTPAELGAAEVKLAVAALEYVNQARGGRIVPTDLSFSIDRTPELLKPETVLAQLATAPSAMIYLRQQHPRHAQFERLRQAYLALRDGKEATPSVVEPEPTPEKPGKGKKGQAQKKSAPKVMSREQQLATLLRNMEMWRWMPRDLGRLHIIANIPEFSFRVMRNDSIEHEERVVVGKVDKQTPVFSDVMETIVFQPFWGVPDSIKIKELLPGLARGGNPLAKNGLRAQMRGRDVEASQINWRQVDIRNIHVYQPPGPSNVLGQMKFMFPNAHQVYMHDTPSKQLFNASQRTFSHGCIRVRNPMRFAEFLLGEDKGWSAEKVRAMVKDGPENNNIKLDSKIPVHIAYFTATVADDGKVRYLADIYGHEKLVQMALDGKAHLIVKKKEDLTAFRAEVIGELSENNSSGSWWGGDSGGGGGFSGFGGGSGAANSNWARDAFRSD